MGTVRIPVANLRILACCAACLCGPWLAACGSTKSDVNDDTSGASSSSEATSTTNGTQTTTNFGAGGVTSSSTQTGGANGTDGGASSSGTGDGGSGGSDASTASGGSDASTASGGSVVTTATAAGGSAGSGGSAGGATNTGGSGVGGSGGSAGGATATNGGSAGSGGTPSECPAPIPFGGPREDGPEPINQVCAQIDDDVILERYADTNAKVPQGLYYEPQGAVSWWEEPCSDSVDETVDRIGDRAIGELQDQVATDWSYTAVGCLNGSHRFYNNLRCDYFDGTTLDGSSAEDLAFLASLLWWMERGNLGGAQILGYAASASGATDTVVMCTIRTTFGDFGLCDQIALEQTQYSITVNGRVTIRETETVRTIEGDCN